MKRFVAFAVSFLLILSMIPATALAEDGGTVVITSDSNPALYGILVDRCGFPNTGSITDTQLATVTELNTGGVPGLTNIDGLENCSSLVNLDLSSCNELERLPSDWSGMAELQMLRLDDLTNLQSIANFHAITTAPKLNCVMICNTDVTDVSFLNASAAPNLRTLLWGDNPSLGASDFATLTGLTQLEVLQLYGDSGVSAGGGEALETLASMGNLACLDLSNCLLSDISGLSGATRLQSLLLQNNYLDLTPGSPDMAVIDGLTQAGCNVNLDGQHQNTIRYASGAGVLSKTSENVYYQQTYTLPEVSEVPEGCAFLGWDTDGDGTADRGAGETLVFAPSIPFGTGTIRYTAVFEPPVQPPAETYVITSSGNPALYNAMIERCGFLDTGGITQEQLDSLTELQLNGIPGLTNIDGLEHCANVYYLCLQDNNDLQRLPADMSGMSSLEIIQLDGIINLNGVDNLHAVTTAPVLRNLSISGSNVTDVSFLSPSAAPNLRFLHLGGIENMTVEDLAAVKGLIQLEGLDLNCNGALFKDQAAALSIAAAMTNLKSLGLSYSQIYDLSPLSGATHLQWLDLSGNYLDPRPGSPDLAVIESLIQMGCQVMYTEQRQFTVKYESQLGMLSKPLDTVYYQQELTLPTVSSLPAGVSFLGWDTNGDGASDRAAGETTPFTVSEWPNFYEEFIYNAVLSIPPQTDDASLLDPGISAGTLNRTFAPDVLSYTLTLSENSPSVTFTPVKADPAARLTINNARRTNFTLKLKPGQTKFVYVKVYKSAKQQHTYTFKVTREKSTNAALASLSTSPKLEFTPAFDAGTLSYTVVVPEGKAGITLRAAKADANATVTIDGAKTRSKYVSVGNASSKTVTVKVKAQAGNEQSYTVKLVRPPHINSFKASPKVAGKYTVRVTAPTQPVKFMYSLAGRGGNALLEIDIGGTWTRIGQTAYTNGGMKTVAWDGKLGGVPAAPGTYQVRLTVTCLFDGVPYSVQKTMAVLVK